MSQCFADERISNLLNSRWKEYTDTSATNSACDVSDENIAESLADISNDLIFPKQTITECISLVSTPVSSPALSTIMTNANDLYSRLQSLLQQAEQIHNGISVNVEDNIQREELQITPLQTPTLTPTTAVSHMLSLLLRGAESPFSTTSSLYSSSQSSSSSSGGGGKRKRGMKDNVIIQFADYQLTHRRLNAIATSAVQRPKLEFLK